MTNTFENKRNNLLTLLEYIDSKELWPPAIYLISYINKSDDVDEDFVDLLANLISEAINNAKDIVDKQKLEKISDFMKGMKDDEVNDRETDKSDIDDLINDLDNI